MKLKQNLSSVFHSENSSTFAAAVVEIKRSREHKNTVGVDTERVATIDTTSSKQVQTLTTCVGR